MRGIEIFLQSAATGCLLHGLAHGLGDHVRVHDHHAHVIARGPAKSLDQGSKRAQKPFLVRIQNGHQGHFWQVQPLAQQVDAHQHAELTLAQGLDDGHPFQSVDVRVHIPRAHAHVLHVFREIFGHALGQGGHQDPLVTFQAQLALGQQVVHLTAYGTDFHHRVQQAGGPDDLLRHPAPTVLQLKRPGSRGDMDHLADPFPELPKAQGTVVQGRGQAEPEFHQGFLAGQVPMVHAPDLGHGDVGLVQEYQEVRGKIVQQTGRRPACQAIVQVPGIVFNARAVAQLLDHFQIQHSPLLQTLGLHQLVLHTQKMQPFPQFLADVGHGPQQVVLVRNIVAGRVDHRLFDLTEPLASQGVDLVNGLQFVAEKIQMQGAFVAVGRNNL